MDVMDEVGELNEADLLSYDVTIPEDPEVPEEAEELLERTCEEEETIEEPEIIYGSPEAVRYFQKASLPPGGTESTAIDVEDLSVRSKLVVRPLSSPDTYVDRHGSPGSRFRKTELVVTLEPEPEPQTQPDIVPLEPELEAESQPGIDPEAWVFLGITSDPESHPVVEANPESEPALESKSALELTSVLKSNTEEIELHEPALDSTPVPDESEEIVEKESRVESNVESVPYKTESVLDTEPAVEEDYEEESDEELAPEEVSELYTDEEDLKNKSHAARVASVLNDIHRPRFDQSPLDERAERMAEAILASALFETVFLQSDDRSESTPVPECSTPDKNDLPFIGSSLCRIRFPFSGT